MKTKLLIIVLCLLVMCVGCVGVRYNPETGEVSYTRIGDQEIAGFYFATDPNGMHVELEKAQSSADAALAVLNKAYLAGLAARALTPVP